MAYLLHHALTVPPRPPRSTVTSFFLLLSLLGGSACGSSSSTSVTGPSPLRCQVSLAASDASFAADGGRGTLIVTTARECSWSASSETGWVSITTSNSGQGNAELGFSVAANTVPSGRRGALTVNDSRAELAQEAAACRFEVSPLRENVGPNGGVVTFSVSTLEGCPWSARSEATWLTITGGGDGDASGTVVVTASGGPGAARTGTVRIAGEVVTIAQQATPSPSPTPPAPSPPPPSSCSYEIAPTALTLPPEGGRATIDIQTRSHCPWSVASHVPWITVVEGASATGDGRSTLSVAAHSGPERTGTLTISARTITVTQRGASLPPAPPPGPSCSYELSPVTYAANEEGDEKEVDVKTSAGCGWSAHSTVSWITITSGASGRGKGKVGYRVDTNTAHSPRTGTLIVAGLTHTVTQSATKEEEGQEFKLQGTVADLSGSCPGIRFRIAGELVVTSSETKYDKKKCHELQHGMVAEVKGRRQSDRSVLAIEVKVKVE